MSSARFWRDGDPLETLRQVVARGGVLGVPTESSYALAVDPASRSGVDAIYRLKRRAAGKPLPVVVADRSQLRRLGAALEFDSMRSLSALWPAPLSLIVQARHDVAAAAGVGTLAVRVPATELLRRLLEELATPLTATSANRSGERPLLEPGAVAELLAAEDGVVVDAGVLPGGDPSTIVRGGRAGVTVVRAGSYPVERLRECLGKGVEIHLDGSLA